MKGRGACLRGHREVGGRRRVGRRAPSATCRTGHDPTTNRVTRSTSRSASLEVCRACAGKRCFSPFQGSRGRVFTEVSRRALFGAAQPRASHRRSARSTTLLLGARGLSIRVARAVNRHLERRGKVFGDRYHPRSLTTPREVRTALVYVLQNWRKPAVLPCRLRVHPILGVRHFGSPVGSDAARFAARVERARSGAYPFAVHVAGLCGLA